MSHHSAHRHPHWTAAALLALTLSLSASLSFAAPDTAFEQARQRFEQAAGGDASAIEPAIQAFEALVRAQPGDPVPLAYAGSATTLRATTTLLPWRKMQYAEDGLALLDKALALLNASHDAPGASGLAPALQVRFTAASNFLSLPDLFKRHARGGKLLAAVLEHPAFASAPLPFKGAVWLRAGREAAKAERPAEARRWWQEVIKNQAPQAAAAQTLLKELGA